VEHIVSMYPQEKKSKVSVATHLEEQTEGFAKRKRHSHEEIVCLAVFVALPPIENEMHCYKMGNRTTAMIS